MAVNQLPTTSLLELFVGLDPRRVYLQEPPGRLSGAKAQSEPQSQTVSWNLATERGGSNPDESDWAMPEDL
jgi:hypothetical protein